MNLVQDLEAEAALLGAMMLGGLETVEAVSAVLPRGSAAAFMGPGHRAVFDSLLEMHADSRPIDLVTLMPVLHARQADLTQSDVLAISESVPHEANAVYYARLVRDKWTLRRIQLFAARLLEQAQDCAADATTIVQSAERALAAIPVNAADDRQPVGVGVLLDAAIAQLAAGTAGGLPTGFVELDRKIAGLRAGQLILLAARPGEGKTSLALQIAGNVVRRSRIPVAVFSLEMGDQSVAVRAIVIATGRTLAEIADSNGDPLIGAAVRELDAGLIVDDCAGAVMAEIRARARRYQVERKIGLVVIDYLGLVRDPAAEQRGRTEQVSNLSRDAKTLARQLNIPVLCLHQLNRGSTIGDHSPQLHHLRDSGSCEQDADVVLFIHPETTWKENEPRPSQHDAWLLVRKNREGPLGNVKLRFIAPITTFEQPVESGPGPEEPMPYGREW